MLSFDTDAEENGRILVNDGKITLRITDDGHGSVWIQNSAGLYVTRMGTDPIGTGLLRVMSHDGDFPPEGSPLVQKHELRGP